MLRTGGHARFGVRFGIAMAPSPPQAHGRRPACKGRGGPAPRAAPRPAPINGTEHP